MMDAGSSPDVVVFEQFRFDRRAGTLSRQSKDDGLLAVGVGSRALAILGVLVERAGDLVSRDEIISAVWPGAAVEESNLTVQLSALRRVLDAGRAGGSCIQNVPGRGYRFLPDVRHLDHRAEQPSGADASPNGGAARPLPVSQKPRRRSPAVWTLVGIAALAVMVVVLASYWSRWARPAAYSSQDRRLSIIVLPFENSSYDLRQDALAAGITRDVTDRFARDGIPVIPAATAATYRGKTVNLQTLALDHNVHFVLTGSARRQDGRLIVSATLNEADPGRTLWSQRFDRPDNSDEWNSVIGQIWDNCIQASVDAEVARAMREHPENLDKRDFQLAVAARIPQSKEDFLKQMALLERALTIDPDYVRALEDKANLYANFVFAGYSPDPSADLSTAMKAADSALKLAPNDVWALRRKASVLHVQGDLDGATALIRKVLELEPLDGWRYRELGIIQMTQGHFKEALENLTIAKRLGGAPPSPNIGESLAFGLLANDRLAEAITEAQLAIAQNGRHSAWLALIAAESQNGQDAEARVSLQKFLAMPRTYRTLAEVQKNPAFAANGKLLDGLRHAGMPEE
jgi:DNA-binding winged helix-turn-helix (wHTH) protein/TolB-like protein/Flp pilus assembly protein TadD